jgi:hypothetical protein
VFTFYIVVVHVAGLALAIAGVVRAGDRPQVLVYAFILEYGLRLATVFAVTRTLAAREDSLLLRLAPLVSRLPPASAKSQPIRYEGSQQAAGPGAYFFTVIFLAFLAVVLGNVNADRELDLDAIRFEQDLQWASGLAIIYWLQSLLTRTTVIDPKARWDVNVGYNTRELTILAVSVLVAGMVVVVRQANDLPSSGWTVLGPLFALRFLYDLWSALPQADREPEPSDSANPSRQHESRPPARLS